MKLIARLTVPLALLAAGLVPAASAAHASVASAAPGTRLWVRTFTGGADRTGLGTGMAVSPDHSIAYVTGFTDEEPGDHATNDTTVAYNTVTGRVLWEARYRGATGYHPRLSPSIVVSPDGSMIFVASAVYRGVGHGTGYLVEAYNAQTGALLWVAQPAGVPSGLPGVHPLAVSPDSSTVFITGGTDVHHARAYVTAAFSAGTGAQLWIATTPFSRPDDQPSAIAVSPDGSTVIVTGLASTVAYAADSGATLWQDDSRQDAVGLAVSPDSSVVYITAADGNKNEFWRTTAYDTASGAELWRARYSAPQNRAGAPAAVVVSPDGHQVIVGGTSVLANGDDRFQLFSYDASTGAQLWAARYSASGHTGTSADAMTITPNGAEVVLTGSVGTSEDSKYVTAGYNATTGAQLWTAWLTGLASSSTIPVSVAASSDGAQVLVTGGSLNDSSREYLTVAYHS